MRFGLQSFALLIAGFACAIPAAAQFTIQDANQGAVVAPPEEAPGASLIPAAPSEEERQALTQAIYDGQTSPVDLIRALEGHLEQYPETTLRGEVEVELVKAAIEALDYPRIVKYGIPALERLPDDILLLDRVTRALLNVGGKENADLAYGYARRFEDMLAGYNVEPGPGATGRADERDRALGRTRLYESRARTVTGDKEEAVRLAARSFATYPDEESAREWAMALYSTGRNDEAITRMAEAFAIPDSRATDAMRLDDRLRLGEWYEAKNGSERGLGDVILEAYDRTSTLVETRRKKVLALDPNAALRDPLEFTLTGLDGKRFQLASVKGQVVVLDFWATWCVPCRAQHPLYEELKQRFPEESGVVFLNINADEDRSVVEPFLTDMGWDKTTYYEDGLARLLSVTQIPSTILFDRQGQLASRMNGFDPNNFVETMTRRIEATLGTAAGEGESTSDETGAAVTIPFGFGPVIGAPEAGETLEPAAPEPPEE